MERVLLGYSGGRESAIAIPWLAEAYGAEIVTLTLDLGQGGDLEDVRDRALAAGAVRAHVLDVREEFTRQYILRALKAGALFHDGRSTATMLGRPLIAQKLVEIAGIEQTTTIAHGAADDPRIGVAARALNPATSRFVTPAMTGSPGGNRRERGSAMKFAGESPDEAAFVEITFDRGVPTAINGIAMQLFDLIGSLDIIAGAHGLGSIDHLETPGAGVLHAVHTDLESGALTDETRRFSRAVTGAVSGDDRHRRLVWSAAPGARCILRHGPGTGQRHRSPQAVQRRVHDCRAQDVRRSRTSDLAAQEAHLHRNGESLMSTLWSGRFEGAPDAAALEWGSSFRFDRRLFEDDVAGSIAWARALANAGVLPLEESRQIEAALNDILEQGRSDAAFVAGPDEDVHSFVERLLVERLGDAGRRLHTGRSRNEQVSLDLRLYLRRRIPELQRAVADVVGALADQAASAGDALMPAFTHFRPAQPVLIAHFFLSHAAPLRRDHARLHWRPRGGERAAARQRRRRRHRLRR